MCDADAVLDFSLPQEIERFVSFFLLVADVVAEEIVDCLLSVSFIAYKYRGFKSSVSALSFGIEYALRFSLYLHLYFFF